MSLATERPTLLLVGGNGSTADRFTRAWPWLEERFEPILVEIAGQGTRAHAAIPASLPGFADDLAAELARAVPEGATRAPICYGHGVGGLVLAHAALRLPWRPARLVLHAPVGARLARRRFPRLMAWRPVRALVQALLGASGIGPRLAARLFDPAGATTAEDRRRFARGYRQARSFAALFTGIDPLAALDGLEALDVPVTLLWGLADEVLGWDQLLPWAEAAVRAPVTARLVPGWRHYPYLDWPAAFAEVLAECAEDLLPTAPVALDQLYHYRPRTKAGRLAGMRRAGLPVPPGWWIPPVALENGSAERLFRGLRGRYAVRSSSHREDQAGHTAAGVFESLLDVAPRELLDACRRVVASGAPEYLARLEGSADGGAAAAVDVLVQEMVAPRAGGVAWTRGLGVDLEITAGRIEQGVSGAVPAVRASLSELGTPWSALPAELPGGLREAGLRQAVWPVLRRVHALFDTGTLDVEWAVDEHGATRILQARPVGERHGARRLLSAANLREIMPPDPSPFFVGAIAAGNHVMPRYYARHDHALAAWHEPFSVTVGGRVYLNADLLTAIMDRWGLPRALVSRGVGGRLPARAPRPLRFLAALPVLLRLLADFTAVQPRTAQALVELRAHLDAAHDLPALARWFENAFATLVIANLRLTGALSAAIPLWPVPPPEIVTVTMARELRAGGQPGAPEESETLAEPSDAARSHSGSAGAAPSPEAFEERWGHRGEYETDPAQPRGEEIRRPGTALALTARPPLPDPLLALPGTMRRLPFLARRHMGAHREWFRDSAMRLWAAFRARMLDHASVHVARGYLRNAGEIWLLTSTELQTLPPETWSERIAARQATAPTPSVTADLFWSDTLTPLGTAPPRVLPLVPGTVTGPALVARTPTEALALLATLSTHDGAPVLIAPAVDPGWLPVFVRVGGVAAELGGRLSHAATLLRELAIPSVLNLPGAMECARTGQRVCLRVPPGSVEIV